MDVLDRYPMIVPYIGRYFCSPDHPSLLLVGESHYLPEGSTQHNTPEAWYTGDATTLNKIEAAWISTAKIIEDSRKERFRNRGHSIWKNSLAVINDAGPRYQDSTQACDHVAFLNFFLRPAREGLSLRVADEDSRLANLRLQEFLARYQPDGLVFVSVLARSKWEKSKDFSIPTVTTPHPCSSWWNRTVKKYGNRKGREILSDFTESIWRVHPSASNSDAG